MRWDCVVSGHSWEGEGNEEESKENVPVDGNLKNEGYFPKE